MARIAMNQEESSFRTQRSLTPIFSAACRCVTTAGAQEQPGGRQEELSGNRRREEEIAEDEVPSPA
jgi:hypothetical protein